MVVSRNKGTLILTLSRARLGWRGAEHTKRTSETPYSREGGGISREGQAD